MNYKGLIYLCNTRNTPVVAISIFFYFSFTENLFQTISHVPYLSENFAEMFVVPFK
jgi:hypothetical protein